MNDEDGEGLYALFKYDYCNYDIAVITYGPFLLICLQGCVGAIFESATRYMTITYAVIGGIIGLQVKPIHLI